jgi:hypothetical protein
MSYPWTRVPQGQPPLDSLQLRLLPLADLFMGLMWSRPGGLSLRNTWVTPATLALSIAVGLGGLVAGPAGVAFALDGGGLVWLFAGLIAIALAVGAASVALYGLRQRVLSRN